MKLIKFFFLILLVSCSYKKSTGNDDLNIQIDTLIIIKEELISSHKKPIVEPENSLNEIDSTFHSIKITEYTQWKKLIVTYVSRDSALRVEKDWQENKIIDTLYNRSTPNILSQISKNLKTGFPRSASYFLERSTGKANHFTYLDIKKRSGKNVEISFTNSKSQELIDLYNSLNSIIDEEETFVANGKIIKDNFVKSDSISTWSEYKRLSNSQIDEFRIGQTNKNNLFRIDSIQLGRLINENSFYKTLFLVSIGNNIQSYYPCIILIEEYESDNVMESLNLFMVDSTFQKIEESIQISSMGQDYSSRWSSFAKLTDSTIQISETINADCEEYNFKSIRKNTLLNMMSTGRIEESRIDTLSIITCTN